MATIHGHNEGRSDHCRDFSSPVRLSEGKPSTIQSKDCLRVAHCHLSVGLRDTDADGCTTAFNTDRSPSGQEVADIEWRAHVYPNPLCSDGVTNSLRLSANYLYL